MRIEKLETKEILDFEKEIGVELVVRERTYTTLLKFYVSFEHSDIKAGIMLVGVYGEGDTITSALIDYCRRISNKTLVLYATKPMYRREIEVPLLSHFGQI